MKPCGLKSLRKTSSRRTTRTLLLATLVVLLIPGALFATYPKNGVFKQLSPKMDWWYYVDNVNWDIKAPDKWVHMMGSMGSSMLLGKVINRYAAAAMVFTFGVYKEYDDGFREGWSYRDLIANALGIAASLSANRNYRLYCAYDMDKVVLLLNITIR